MPPTSNMRKSSTQTMTAGDPSASAPAVRNGVQPRRTARANTTRPANYYARPFGSFSTGVDHDNDAAIMADSQAAGFFSALQYFTDAITALPKEVQKQITLVKEVEAKVHGPNETMGEILDTLLEYPVPTRKPTAGAGGANAPTAGVLALTANNSTSGSANVSLVNGATGRHSVQPSLVGSLNGEETYDFETERARRQQYHNLRMITAGLLPNLDEKNVVLSEATRVLALQQTRVDSVWPHVESELSEEARMGSMTHWAYSDNRQKTKTTASGAQNRRDVAATNNLAAAASMLHETEIAQARRDAGREATREKTKGKRTEQPGDSDFDDKPRKAPKISKKAANAAAAGLGISTNGEPATKRKKVDKSLGAPGMERTISATGKAAKASKETPRSTAAAATEPVVKKTKGKPGPPPKKKVPASAQNSPMLASSPLVASSNPVFEPPNGRPQSSRARQNSTATNLRHEQLQDEEAVTSRPTSASGKSNGNGNGERGNGRRKVHETTEQHDEIVGDEHGDKHLKDAADKMKQEDTDMPDAGAERPAASRSGSNSRKNSGRNSKVGTPRTDSFPADAPGMSRTRSTRSKPNARGEGDDSDSVEPPLAGTGTGKHRRHASNSHLVKQLAPFNKSPDLDRHRGGEDMDEELDSLDEKHLGEDEAEPEEVAPVLEQEARRSSTRRPVSRRNTVNNIRSSPAPMSRESSPPVSPPPTTTRGSGRSSSRREAEAEAARREAEAEAEAEAEEAEAEVEEEPVAQPEADDEDEESEHDPDDPDEPKYCYCNRGSYGEMVACDNDSCPREWFHLGCTELREAPSEEEKWYCRECRPLFGQKVGRKGKAGRGRGG
ncbi:hypothetical protein M409DRAFT_68870 [Zasmidium cellare ATCC 36951]|uniref:PHD-type domain-containing protein n=1 Tax=Zasmidium cellare ATCC 36951 TaxID=1080233 RepID=A0A6A6C716_ZASCE|nr:uncharacterized protein M409DRAFT_68870 [Zasmidium cellare ATCC 36951]KAF2162914.1 hypothetical protein M409DRAFT_68870 [Zasmidium cellare ATCC 36951]